jgi:hypothetical protein
LRRLADHGNRLAPGSVSFALDLLFMAGYTITLESGEIFTYDEEMAIFDAADKQWVMC